jgi:hypothetical protein
LIGEAVLLASITLTEFQRFKRRQNKELPVLLKVLVVFAILPLLIYRGLYWEIVAANSAASIYRQQYQAGQFFSRYYHGQPIVANDVGIVSYYADVQCFDLWGLGNNEVAYRMSRGTFTTPVIAQMATQRNVRVGFLYANEFYGAQSLPERWLTVATWTIPSERGFTARPTITFFAMDQKDAAKLLLNLKEFQKDLPAEVKVLTRDGLPISN